MLQIIQIAIIVGCLGNGLAQRVPPGVPPQHYQQVPQQQQQQQYAQHQQYQQQQYAPQHGQQQQQHIPVQQQQHVPVQQQQFQQQQHVPVQQQQQVPVQQGHQGGHGHHGGQPQQILSAANLEHEKEHLAEHLHAPIDTSKMTEQELQFHYFKMHDADNNNKLDGCELIKSLIHWHEQGSKEKNGVEEKVFKDEELVNLIDPILNVDDLNKDGYIDYPEFIKAQQKAALQRQQEQ